MQEKVESFIIKGKENIEVKMVAEYDGLTIYGVGDGIRFSIDKNGCWLCTSHFSSKKSYPKIQVNHVVKKINKFLYEKINGPVSDGTIMRHKCDNFTCINPLHMAEGTTLDNIHDRVERNRSASGERHGRAKLTRNKVKKILSDTETPICELARLFGVTPKAIRLIKQRRNWKHVA